MLALSVACTAAAAVWAYLVLGHGGYWRTSQRLPPTAAEPPRPAADPGPWPDVVAVIPARDEAAMLPVVLPTLLGQDYPGALTVILVDDCSTDGTAEVAAALGPVPGPAGGGRRAAAARLGRQGMGHGPGPGHGRRRRRQGGRRQGGRRQGGR